MFCIPKYFKKSWQYIFNMDNQQKMIKYIEKNSIYLNPNELFNNNYLIESTPLTPLSYSCYYKLDLVAIKIIEIYGNKCNIQYVDGVKKTIFYYAIINNLKNVVEKMIDKFGYDIIEFNNYDNFNEYIDMFIFITLKYGNKFNLKSLDNVDCNGNTILMWVCSKLLDEFAIYLIDIFGEKCNIEHVNKYGKCALGIAIDNKLDNVIKKILNKFEINKIINYNFNYDVNMILYLVNNYNKLLIIDNLDNNNNTMLIWSCIKSHDNLAIKLIDIFGEKCNITQENLQGDTALKCAINYKLENVAIKLLNTFGEKCYIDLDIISNNGPLKLAIKNKLENVAIKILNLCHNKYKIDKNILIDCCYNGLENFICEFIEQHYKSWNNYYIDIFINKTLEYCIVNKLESIAIKILQIINKLFNSDQINMINTNLLINSLENKLVNFANEFINIIVSRYNNDKICTIYIGGINCAINNNLDTVSKKILMTFDTICKNIDDLKNFYYIGFISACDKKNISISDLIINKIVIHLNLKINNSFYNELLIYSIISKLEDISIKILDIFDNRCMIYKFNSNNQNLFSLAIENKLENLAIHMMKKYRNKCNPEQINIRNNTPLIIACINKLKNVIIQMIETYGNRCKPEQINIDGNTALITACINNENSIINLNKCNDICLLLIEKFGNKLNFNNKNNENKTALDYSIKYNLYDVTTKLKTLHIKKAFNCENEKCIICMDGLKDTCVLLTSCGHSCFCNDCVVKLTKCSICNIPILDKYEIPVRISK